MAKQRLFTVINIIGLAMGMSVSLLILAILSQVLSFDTFHEHKDRIYRVTSVVTDETGTNGYATTFSDVYSELKEGYSGIEQVAVLDPISLTVSRGTNEISFAGVRTNPAFFKMFSFPLAQGNAKTCLASPNAVVLSTEAAQTLYPKSDPMGEFIQMADGTTYEVTGVLAPHPRQTHLAYDMLIAYNEPSGKPWNEVTGGYVYLLGSLDSEKEDFSGMLFNLEQKARPFQEAAVSFELQPFTQISPGRDLWFDNTPFDWITTLLLFVLGLLILIPACFNYSNLMIARSLKRSKEIGIRKVVGSYKAQIRAQFVVESLLLTLVALIGSVLVFVLIRDEFLSQIRGAEALDLSLNFSMLLWFLGFGVLSGVLVGLFPAIYFSKISPLIALKGEAKTTSASISTIRKSLMVAQFSLSLAFVIGVGVTAGQYHHLMNFEAGFDKENVLVVPLMGQNPQLVLNEFSSLSEVKSAVLTSSLPGIEAGGPVWFPSSSEMVDSVQAYQFFVGDRFVSSLNFKMKWGHEPTREQEVLINESFMENMKTSQGSDSLILIGEDHQRLVISGVVRDFNYMPLNQLIEPLVIRYAPEKTGYLLLTLKSNDLKQTIGALDDRWSSITQKVPFEAFFLSQKTEEAYQSVVTMIKMFSFLGFLSITISCIGILGMVVYLTENRTKELAIRKTMGATLFNLYMVLGKSFMKLLFIAIAITTPLAYLFYDGIYVQLISKYSEGIGWQEIVLSIGIMVVLGTLPLLWMITKISRVNPAENLRYE